MNKRFAVLLLSVAGMTVAASANAGGLPSWLDNLFNLFHPTPVCHANCRVSAPEIDPASALGALTLLGGGLLVLRGRRSKK
jgi:hypothetical protein